MANNQSNNFKFGMECEFFTLDNEGFISNYADRLIAKVRIKYPDIIIKREVGKNMIEINSFAHKDTTKVIHAFLEDLENVLYIAKKENIILFPLGTYPGQFTPELNSENGYSIQEQIFGRSRFLIAGRVIGLHCHFSLPHGVFDYINKILKELVTLKNKDTFIGMYNLYIAMDPALTTFTQCSPFYQGKLLGKDSRMIMYRGGDALNNKVGLYANYPKFGQLQPYKYTGTDILELIDNKYQEWADILKSLDTNIKVFMKHGSILDTAWNPVKINSHGTLEQRGMDMNYPSVVFSVAVLLKNISKYVVENNIEVVPSDLGIKEPFKLVRNKLYIPPHTYVRNKLQKDSAYLGLKSPEVYKYCSALLKFAHSITPKNLHFLDKLEEMIHSRETVSDLIIKRAQMMGIKNDISKKKAAKLALSLSADIYEDILITKKIIKDIDD